MYKSPIDLMRTMQTQIETDIENHVLTAIERVGVYVDKHELIKALQYDRDQYDKGFADGRKEAAKEIINKIKRKYGKSCSEYYPLLIEITSEELDDLAKQCGVEVE